MRADERDASQRLHSLAEPSQSAAAGAGQHEAASTSDDDSLCWVCGGPVVERHCKIVCPRCGFTRDCSDP